MSTERILICGDRNYQNEKIIYNVIKEFDKDTVIIHGNCRGVDKLAGKVGENLGMKIEVYDADWNRYGKGAGPIRNKQMLVQGKPTLVIAFHKNYENSKGTKNMIKQANNDGLFIILYDDASSDGLFIYDNVFKKYPIEEVESLGVFDNKLYFPNKKNIRSYGKKTDKILIGWLEEILDKIEPNNKNKDKIIIETKKILYKKIESFGNYIDITLIQCLGISVLLNVINFSPYIISDITAQDMTFWTGGACTEFLIIKMKDDIDSKIFSENAKKVNSDNFKNIKRFCDNPSLDTLILIPGKYMKFMLSIIKKIWEENYISNDPNKVDQIFSIYVKLKNLRFNLDKKKIKDMTQYELDYLIFKSKFIYKKQQVNIKCNIDEKKNELKSFEIIRSGEKLIFNKKKFLTSGASGQIYIYTSGKINYIVKQMTINDPENLLIDYFNDIYNCGIINALSLCKLESGSFVLLELMEGDLYNKKFSKKEIEYIIDTIRMQLQCLIDIESPFVLGYLDLKLGNILFKGKGDNLVVKLGDLGSMYKIWSNEYASTYPCYYNIKNFKGTSIEWYEEKHIVPCMRYLLGRIAVILSGVYKKFKISDEFILDKQGPFIASPMRKQMSEELVREFGDKYKNLLWDLDSDKRTTLYN